MTRTKNGLADGIFQLVSPSAYRNTVKSLERQVILGQTVRGTSDFDGEGVTVHQVVRGRGKVVTDRCEHILGPDGYLVINSGSPHQVVAGSAPVWTLTLHPALVSGLRFEECLTPRDFFVDRAVSSLLGGEVEAVGQLANALRFAHTGSPQTYHLAERPDAGAELGRVMRSARAYVLTQLRSPLSVPGLARQVALSEFHFHRCFTNWHGLTPARYITTERVRRACRLLVLTESTVAQIAKSCGYWSATSFVRAFQSITSCTPREFRALRQHHRSELAFYARSLQSC